MRRATVVLLVLAFGDDGPARVSAAALPRPYLAWYKAAARTCPGLS